jgi:transposase
MGHIHGLDRQQRVLFPDSLDDYIDAANPVRFLDAFVDSLDLNELGFRHAIPDQIGRPSYHPGDLLAYSGRRLPLIPVETCHRFQSKVATDSD